MLAEERELGRAKPKRNWAGSYMLAEERVVETEGNQRDRERGTGQVVISAHVG